MSNQNKISLSTAILMNMNIMIGGGVFAFPAIMAAISTYQGGVLGNASFLGWGLTALCILPIVWTISKVTQMLPGAGGFYSYSKEGLGHSLGLLSIWCYIIGYTSSAACEVLLMKNIISSYVPATLVDIQAHPIAFNIIVAVAITGLNLLGIRIIGKIQSSITLFKLLPIVCLIALFPLCWNSAFTIEWTSLSYLPKTLSFAVFGFLGFESCCSISHLIEDSEKNASRALLYAFMLISSIYSLFHFALLHTMGTENLIKFGGQAFPRFINLPIPYFSTILEIIIAGVFCITFFGAALGMMLGVTACLHSLAQNDLVYGSSLINKVNKESRPWICALIVAGGVLLLSWILPNIELLASICNMGVFGAFTLTCLSLLVLQAKKQFYLQAVISLIGLGASAAITVYQWTTLGSSFTAQLATAAPMLVAIAIGLALSKHSTRA